MGIIECACSKRCKEDIFGNVFISLQDIADCMIRYYWNQSFFFKLKQQPGDRVPEVYQCVNALIDKYKDISGSNLPVWSDRGLLLVQAAEPAFYEKQRHKAAKILPHDVAHRLKNLKGKVVDVYRYNPATDDSLCFKKHEVELISEYSEILSRLFSFKWSQLLEKWNESPRLLSKVVGASDSEIRRHSLTEFRKPLSAEFGGGPILDFYTHKPLKDNDVSIDHVIPWSYVYSDDIWNLVFTSRSNNSKKSNATPAKATIESLKKRNDRLEPLLHGNKYGLELFEAKQEGLVDRYYFGLQRSYI